MAEAQALEPVLDRAEATALAVAGKGLQGDGDKWYGPRDEVEMLKEEADALKNELDAINGRIEELESRAAESGS